MEGRGREGGREEGGRKGGREGGREEGREEGREKGREEGREEGKEGGREGGREWLSAHSHVLLCAGIGPSFGKLVGKTEILPYDLDLAQWLHQSYGRTAARGWCKRPPK